MVGTDVVRGRAGRAAGDLLGPDAEPRVDAHEHPPAPRVFGLHRTPVVVLVVGLVVTAVLSLVAGSVHDNNENHLLHQRVSEAATVIGAASSSIQTPLSSAAILAEATNADTADFANLMAPLASGTPFVSASIWRVGAVAPRPLFVVGRQPELASFPAADVRAFLARTAAQPKVAILDLLGRDPRRLGYGVSTGVKPRFVVYAESARPPNRRATVDSNTAFSDLDYAIYLGDRAVPSSLLASSVPDAAFSARTAAETVNFGDSKLHLVMAPRGELGGELLARLPWIIAVLGFVVAAAAALLTERLVRRREDAERLAGLNARLFSEQRSVAQTLQNSLLPEVLPSFPGLEIAVRYVPGVDGVDVGGDWYDVIDLGAGRVLLVVGDVSGRGLRAATVMASLRYAIRAFASQGDGPEAVLLKLSRMIDVGRDAHFATVLCGLVDVAERRVTYANAGHPNPLLVTGTTGEFITTNVGAPIGVAHDVAPAVTVSVPPGGVVLAYTDGLVERRGESPDASAARMRDAAVGYDSLDDMLDGLLGALTPEGVNDDTAILAVRWRP